MKRYTIGRDRSNDIVIADDSVSRRHAELLDDGAGAYRLVDSGSSNGTWCMGDAGWKQVMSAELDADAMVRIGDHLTSVAALLMEAGVEVPRRASDERTRTGKR